MIIKIKRQIYYLQFKTKALRFKQSAYKPIQEYIGNDNDEKYFAFDLELENW